MDVDGTDWRRESPPHRPLADGQIAFDASQGDVVPFDGVGFSHRTAKRGSTSREDDP
jgi:hypothetical protein